MRSRAYVTVPCPSVRPSVCAIRPRQQRAAGLLLRARPVGDIDRLLHGRGAAARRAAANADRAAFTAEYTGLFRLFVKFFICYIPAKKDYGRLYHNTLK